MSLMEIQTIKNFFAKINGNLFTVLAVQACIVLLIWCYSCEPRVKSLKGSSEPVTRQELQIELDTYLAQAKIKFEQLDKQDQFKQTLVNAAITYVQGGQINPIALVVSLFAILGFGQTGDKVRKKIQSAKPSS